MVESPTRPVVTVVTVCLPLARTVTVEMGPVVVMAALGTSNVLLAVWTTTLMSAVIPTFTFEGGLCKAMVTS